jgi:hypothetical protein
MAGGIEFNSGKFNELVLLLADRSKDDPRMSRVKLNKLLYRCDFESFRIFGRSMTGAIYVRGEFGPMAAELPRTEENLGRRGLLIWRREGEQKIPTATEAADESLFSGEELEIVARTLSELQEHGGKGASDWSHENSAGWNLATDEGEPIPYETALISMKRPTRAMFEHAERLSRQRNWAAVRP